MPEMKSLSNIWDRTWDLYTKNFKSTSVLVLIFSVPLIILYLFAPYSMFKPDLLNGRWIFFTADILLGALIGMVLSLSLNYNIYQSSKNHKVKFIDALRFALSKFWTAFGTSLLMALMLIGLFLLLIVPGIIFAIYWSFLVPVIIIKNLSGKKALDYSKSVVRKRWWKTLGYSIVLGLIPVAIIMIVMFLMTAYYPSNIGYSIYYIISLLASIFIYTSQIVLFLELDRTKVK